jgi:glutathione peroxidase
MKHTVMMAGALALTAMAAAWAQPEKSQPEKPGSTPASPATPAPAKPAAPTAPAAPAAPVAPAVDDHVLNTTVKSLDGKDVDLSQYKGKVVVLVNVASKCGFTPQYAALEDLYQRRQKDGLVIIGFPANNFGAQEPGTAEEIRQFCDSTYHVTFPLMAKISVKGPDQHPLYKQLASQPKPIGGDPKWNFTKFVVDREGKVVARFDADKKYVRKPELEPELERKVDELLAAKPR